MTTRCSFDAADRSVIQTQRQSSVRFATVSVRQFSYTLGDSPSTTCGPPTALSWSYSCPNHLNSISIERYEALCHPRDQPRRSRRELKMSVERRRQILYDVCDDNDVDNDDDGTSSSNNGNNHKITPKLIARAERRVERCRLRLERNRAYANLTTCFPRRINATGRSASFPPNKHSQCDAVVELNSCGSRKECNVIDLDHRKNASWDNLLSTLDTTPDYLKTTEGRKAELLREELFLPKTSAANASTVSNISQVQQCGGWVLVEHHAVTKNNNRVSKQRSFNSRAA